MTKIPPVNVGVVGAGNISGIYLEKGQTFEILSITAVADLIRERAEQQAEIYQIPCVLSTDEMLSDPSIDIILNLTTPDAHADIAFQALESGKSIYNEKPLAITREDGQKILALARQKNLLVGGAPDTFLGGGLQTCRKLINDGWIGTPVAATAFMLCHGHESWHPDPEFYYKVGGGPMFDMGPYYLTALISLMGPVKRVTGSTRATFPTRTITSEFKYGQLISVDVPTHVAGILEFASGAIATIITSFDVWNHHLPFIEIYGTAGSLSVPDPNTFGGPVSVRRPGAEFWSDIPLTHGYAQNSRSLGLADMAYALRTGRPQRASGELCFHVLDIMHAIHEASDSGHHILLDSTCPQPAPLPMDLTPGKLDEK
ncbi:MAG: Gfo/Idh/MocA family protein [Anaerolineales bacterium]